MVETYQGSLFSGDFLTDSITRLPDWAEVSDAEMADLAVKLACVSRKLDSAILVVKATENWV
jgi:hypothetical protein